MSKYQLRNTILDLLLRIDQDSGYSHLLIDNEIKNKNIGPKDQGLLTEVVYGTIERKQTLDYYLEPFIKDNKKVEQWVRMLLRMSVYQMVFLDKVPTYAIINEAVEISKQRGHKGIASFVNGVLRNVQRKGVQDVAEIKDETERLAIETSHPVWLVERWIKQYGYENTEAMCKMNLARKPLSIRVQPLKITREEAIEKLAEQDITAKPSMFSDQGIIVESGNVLHTDLFKEGFISIQDQSSMLATEMLKVKEDMTVLDTCSAPGGKVTHIAEKMNNKGAIHAYDLHKRKARSIRDKAEILDLSIINANQGDARKLAEKYDVETFDRIIVDAPCSGLGVIRSKPDIKYNKSIEDIENLAKIQLDILLSVASLLKKDGMLVYSTCTVDRLENDETVKQFLSKETSFRVDPAFFTELPEVLDDAIGINEYGLQLFPHEFNTDGFFITRFIKN